MFIRTYPTSDYQTINIIFIDCKRSFINYFGTAVVSASPLALADLSRVENADGEELLDIAIEIGLNLSNYKIAYNHKL